MKDKLKGLILGIVIGALLVPATFATVGSVTKELHYNNIKISMDGKEITPKDANGQYTEPFTIDGTTYLPVRGIASALNLGVEWDSATSTVKLSSGNQNASVGGKVNVGDLIFNEVGINVTLQNIEEGNNYNTYYFLVENTTDNVVSFYGRNVSANDFMIYSDIVADIIQPHKKYVASLLVAKGDYSQHKQDTIEKIEFTAKYNVTDNNNSQLDHGEKLVTLYF